MRIPPGNKKKENCSMTASTSGTAATAAGKTAKPANDPATAPAHDPFSEKVNIIAVDAAGGQASTAEGAGKAGEAGGRADDVASLPDVVDSALAGVLDVTVDLTEGESGNAEVAEEEEDALLAPESAAAEEERLRKAREDKENQQEATGSSVKAALEVSKFSQLEHLLNTTGLYTKFLSEQMQEIASKTEAGASGSAPAGAGSKRKGGAGGSGRGAKKAKVAANPTSELMPLIEGELRDYQLKGVKWMISLYQNGLNGILADQMGLGKTVQTIGFLSHLHSKGVHGPFMVIGPLSTLPNWINEFKRWCPSMPALLYHGNKHERARLRTQHLSATKEKGKPLQVPPTFPVIVTSYEIVMADSKALAKLEFKYIVVDEGHRLKNSNCKLIRELRTIPSANKLLLTGTPLQNNLPELWSLLNFILPDIFSSLADFQSWFDFSGVVNDAGQDVKAAEQRSHVVSKLHSILQPFLLRRIKADVEIALPAKQEMVLYAQMTEVQRNLNKQLLEGTLGEEMVRRVKEEGGSTAKLGILRNVLMQMRKNCNHPDLITGAFVQDFAYPPPEVLVEQCGKMALLERLLQRLFAGGHKVLIFSQMTSMLDLIESYLEQKGHRACRIDGSIPWQVRQQNISDFNSDPEARVFLLSTRAGGLGINLTAADTCIIYDSDWNPQQDLQAMDRCHRIGQKKPVLVLRLATGNSVEGQMLRRAASKMMLEKIVIKQGVFKQIISDNKDSSKPSSTSMSVAELLDLLRADCNMNDETQSGEVDDQMLDRLLDRTHLEQHQAPPYPTSGVGYEVVTVKDDSALLQSVQ